MLTERDRQAIAAVDEAYGRLSYLLYEYERDMSLPHYLDHQVRHQYDDLLQLQQWIASLDVGRPYRTVESIAPLITGYAAVGEELLHPIHTRMARRYDGYMGSLFIVSLIRTFRERLEAVLGIPGLRAAIRRFQDRLRQERRRRASRPITELNPSGHPPIRIGELSGPFQVVRIEVGSQIFAENIQTRREVRFTIPQWLQHRQDVEISRRLLGSLQANPILQFGYGFAEGFGEQVRGIIELFGQLRGVLDAIASRLSNLGQAIRDAANQLLEAIMEWGRRFGGAEIPQRARMAGRLLGSIFFEIVMELSTGGMLAALRSSFAALRGARGLGGVFRMVDRVGDATRVMQRVVRRTLSGAARRVLVASRLIVRGLRQRYLRTAFIVAHGVLEVAGEFVRGTIRRVAQAGETVFVFVVEGSEELMVRLGRQLELPDNLAVWPEGAVCAGP